MDRVASPPPFTNSFMQVVLETSTIINQPPPLNQYSLLYMGSHPISHLPGKISESAPANTSLISSLNLIYSFINSPIHNISMKKRRKNNYYTCSNIRELSRYLHSSIYIYYTRCTARYVLNTFNVCNNSYAENDGLVTVFIPQT